MIRFGDGRDWFLDKRFGMFIHWGIYSSRGKTEWERKSHNVPREEYDKSIKDFTAEHFDPAQWLDVAQAAGMEYIVFTTKHHDGFCMWDTKFTSYNVMQTPFGKDPLRMLADECHKRNFPLVLYYSCMDWGHENYPNDGTCNGIQTDPAKHDMKLYMDFVKNQIRELCTEYGEIHGLWWDNNCRRYADPEVNALARSLQPKIVINDRGFSNDGDYRTPERTGKTDDYPFGLPTEACDSVTCNGWCYQFDGDYYSSRYLCESIARYIGHGGNYLLNIAPAADGRLQERGVELLKKISPWFQSVKEALYAPHQQWIVYNQNVFCTGQGHDLYFFLLKPPAKSIIQLIPVNTKPEKVVLLNTGDVLEGSCDPRGNKEAALTIRRYPADELYGEIPVLKVTFREEIAQVIAEASHHHYAWPI